MDNLKGENSDHPFDKFNSKNNSSQDDDDELLHEIDVVVSHDFLESVKLVQYPLRPHWRAYDDSLLKEIRYKFGVDILEMDYSLPKYEIEEQKYNTTIIYDSEGRVVPNPTKQMEQHTIRSSSIPAKSNYAIGVYRSDSLILLPIQDILQMRPNFGYFDNANIKKKETNDVIESNDIDLASSSDALKPLQIQVRGQESERAIATRLKSYAYLKQQENEDVFKKLSLVNRESHETSNLFSKIISPKIEDVDYENVSLDDYITMILPSIDPVTTEYDSILDTKSEYKSTTVTLDSIRQLPNEQQIEMLLKNANVVTLSQIMTYSVLQNESEAIKILQKKAVLVQGVWVIKSEFVFKDRKAKTRNWVLSQFGRSDELVYVNRKDVSIKCNVSSEIVKEVMEEITDLVPGKGWKLKKAPDLIFIQKYSKLHSSSKKNWEKEMSIMQSELE